MDVETVQLVLPWQKRFIRVTGYALDRNHVNTGYRQTGTWKGSIMIITATGVGYAKPIHPLDLYTTWVVCVAESGGTSESDGGSPHFESLSSWPHILLPTRGPIVAERVPPQRLIPPTCYPRFVSLTSIWARFPNLFYQA